MELRTADDQRKSFWYDNSEESIKVQPPDYAKNCSYTIDRAENPGLYNINFKCYKTHDPFSAVVTIEGKEVPQRITVTVVPGAPFKSRLFRESSRNYHS